MCRLIYTRHMCGRYLLRDQPEWATHTSWQQYWQEVSILSPRYNIAPSQLAPIVYYDNDDILVKSMQWGFRPNWAKPSFAKINARSESFLSSKMFAHSAKHRRCLIPADGFYEPKGVDTVKSRPWYLFEQEDQSAFMMAGIWTTFDDGNESFDNFAIITSGPNQLMEPIHDRMPVILPNEYWQPWLTSNNEKGILELCKVRQWPKMTKRAVGDHAKNPRNEGKKCIENNDPINLDLFS